MQHWERERERERERDCTVWWDCLGIWRKDDWIQWMCWVDRKATNGMDEQCKGCLMQDECVEGGILVVYSEMNGEKLWMHEWWASGSQLSDQSDPALEIAQCAVIHTYIEWYGEDGSTNIPPSTHSSCIRHPSLHCTSIPFVAFLSIQRIHWIQSSFLHMPKQS